MEQFYRDYLNETYGGRLILAEGGFIAYRVAGPQLYISDFYISPEFRQSPKHFEWLFMSAVRAAKDSGCKFIAAHVHLGMRNAQRLIQAYLKYGFEIRGMDPGNLLTVVRDLPDA